MGARRAAARLLRAPVDGPGAEGSAHPNRSRSRTGIARQASGRKPRTTTGHRLHRWQRGGGRGRPSRRRIGRCVRGSSRFVSPSWSGQAAAAQEAESRAHGGCRRVRRRPARWYGGSRGGTARKHRSRTSPRSTARGDRPPGGMSRRRAALARTRSRCTVDDRRRVAGQSSEPLSGRAFCIGPRF